MQPVYACQSCLTSLLAPRPRFSRDAAGRGDAVARQLGDVLRHFAVHHRLVANADRGAWRRPPGRVGRPRPPGSARLPKPRAEALKFFPEASITGLRVQVSGGWHGSRIESHAAMMARILN